MKRFLSSADGRRDRLADEPGEVSRQPDPAITPAVKRKHPGGRPVGTGRLTPELQERFCAAVAGGMFLNRAAKLCQISIDSFETWVAKGKKSIEPYAAFVVAYEKAEVECEALLVKTVMDAAPSDYRAALAMLKSRYPTQWSDHAQRLAVFGPDGDGVMLGNSLIVHIDLNMFDKERDAKERIALDEAALRTARIVGPTQ